MCKLIVKHLLIPYSVGSDRSDVEGVSPAGMNVEELGRPCRREGGPSVARRRVMVAGSPLTGVLATKTAARAASSPSFWGVPGGEEPGRFGVIRMAGN